MQTNDMRMTQAKAYATPKLKLYGDVRMLTAAGTGPTSETGNMGAGIMSCYDGMTCGTNTARKHCI